MEVEGKKNSEVTIHRTWDKKEDDMDISVSSPDDTVSTNIASGGDKITGADGAYHGETPAPVAPTPTPTPTPTATTKPSSTAAKATPESSSKPATTTPEPNANTPSSSGSTSSTSTPNNGDTRTVDGQQQMYILGFGWVDKGSGSESNYEEGPVLTGEYVGEMG